MLAEVAPAAEGPVLLIFVVGLLALLAAFGARALIYLWKYSIGWILLGLADRLVIHALGLTVNLGGWLRSANDAIIGWLGAFAAQSDHAAGRMFHQAALIQRWVVYEISQLAKDTLHVSTWIIHKGLPDLLREVRRHYAPAYLLGKLIDLAIRTNWHWMLRAVKAVVHVAERGLYLAYVAPFVAQWHFAKRWQRWFRRLLEITAGWGEGGLRALEHTLPRLRGLEFWRGRTDLRLRRLEGLLGVTGIATVMAMALGLPDWRCITRGNLGRTSRALCGVSGAFLDDILGLLTDFLIIENICKVLPWLEEAASVVGVPLVEGIAHVANAGVCPGSTLAPKLRPPALALPAVEGVHLHLIG